MTKLRERIPDFDARSVRLALKVCSHWGLADDKIAQLMGHSGTKTIRSWLTEEKLTKPVSQNEMDRVGAILDIHAHLRSLFSNPENVYNWVHRDNSHFSDSSPLSVMMTGSEGIAQVRQYLQAQMQ